MGAKRCATIRANAGGHRRFSFEAVQCFAEQRGLQLTPVPIGKGELCNLLIVEDDEQLRDFLIELLAEYSDQLSVTTAATAFEAGRRVEALKPDLILLDLMLPGVDGVEICRELKAAPETQGIRIIAMTGYYTEENIARILSAGAEECLRKPLDIPRLLKICTQR